MTTSMKNPDDVAELLRRATSGDEAALSTLVDAVRHDIYGLAMRMLGHPADAEDATQEILILIITHLAGFEGRSSFRTWTWKIASRHLLRVKRGRREVISFDDLDRILDEGQREGASVPLVPATSEDALYTREAKFGCTQAMLLGLDREHRVAFILCEILDLSGEEAADVLEIAPAALRKRLSRANQRLQEFMHGRCSLIDEANPCQCARQVPCAIRTGHLVPGHLLYATHPTRKGEGAAMHQSLAEVDELQRIVGVLRGHPDYAAPDSLRDGIRSLITGGRFRILES